MKVLSPSAGRICAIDLVKSTAERANWAPRTAPMQTATQAAHAAPKPGNLLWM